MKKETSTESKVKDIVAEDTLVEVTPVVEVTKTKVETIDELEEKIQTLKQQKIDSARENFVNIEPYKLIKNYHKNKPVRSEFEARIDAAVQKRLRQLRRKK